MCSARRLLLLGLLAACLTSCLALAAVAGAGAVVLYDQGELEGVVEASPGAVIGVAAQTLHELDMTVESSRQTAIDGYLVARTAQRDRVAITVRQEGRSLARIAIRVGVLGDEELSRAIYQRILALL